MKIISKNPRTGEVIAELGSTTPAQVNEAFARAKIAQKKWASVSIKNRCKKLRDLRETLLNHQAEITDLICQENGKPKVESLTADLLPAVFLLSYFSKNGAKFLRDKKITISNPLLKHRKSKISYWPFGTVAVISPWNFPFFLPFGEIAMAMLAGNAVIFKPSEITPMVGLKIQEMVQKAGFPEHLLQTVIGDGSLGAEVIKNHPDKIFFTGSDATGRKIASEAGKQLIPVCLELGGKDPMIILPDADIDFSTSAALWGCFSNSGQMCASTERIFVHESIADKFIADLTEKAEKLTKSDFGSTEGELGCITAEKQKEVYEAHINDAKEKGATFVTGGIFDPERRRLAPTIILGKNVTELSVYKDETFGPVVAIEKFQSVSTAIEKANESRFGLTASVMTKSSSLGEDVASQLEYGTVTINEVAYTGGVPETPWSGVKDSGYGVKHSQAGLLEFVHARHINEPVAQALSIKSLWWFPYQENQYELFRQILELQRNSWIDKAKALPLFLYRLVKELKVDR